jgi:hypothetical protein
VKALTLSGTLLIAWFCRVAVTTTSDTVALEAAPTLAGVSAQAAPDASSGTAAAARNND